jgi:non-ribosomal peptide synthetase component F
MTIIDVNKDLAALFEQQASATPDAVALEDEKRSLTYAELDRETWALAERLRDYGVGRDDLVGVLMGRSADYVIAALAALRAGGAFLVLEVAYPPGLLRDVIEDAKPTVILTQVEHSANLTSFYPSLLPTTRIHNEVRSRYPRRCCICLCPLDMAATLGRLHGPGHQVHANRQGQQPH